MTDYQTDVRCSAFSGLSRDFSPARKLRRNHFSRIVSLSFLLLTILACLALLSGCLASSARRPPSEPPSAQGPAMDMALALKRQGESISSFAARGAAEYVNGKSRHFFRFELLARRPGDFSFTILDPFGRPAVRVQVNRGFFAALEYGPAVATVGAASPASLERFLPLGLRSEDFLALLLGTLIPEPSEASLSGKRLSVAPAGFWSDSVWQVSLGDDDGTFIQGFSVQANNNPSIQAEYGNFAQLPLEDIGQNVFFPQRLFLSWGGSRTLLLRYEEIRLGFPTEEAMFSTQPPNGFSIVEL